MLVWVEVLLSAGGVTVALEPATAAFCSAVSTGADRL